MKIPKSWPLVAALPIGIAILWLVGGRAPIRIDDARLAAPLIEVRADVPGILSHLNIEEGGWIEKGETLFSLSAAEEEADLAAQQTAIEALRHKLAGHLAEAEAAMQEYLNARSDEAIGMQDHSEQPLARLGAQQGLAEQCRKEIAAAAQKVELAKTVIQRKHVPSPASGYLIERKKGDGEATLPGDAVCLLCNAKTLWIEAVVPETSASQIQIGQRATARLPSDTSLKWEGEISWISPIALPNHAGIPVRISLKEGYPDCLRPNLQVQLTLHAPS